MIKKELVSIVTANYNAEKFIVETIDSVLSQSYQNWEMIIVDDCSTDGSIGIVKEYIAKDSRIRLIQLEQNSGPAVARNRAIEEAKGRYIAFLDSDDIWKPEKLEKQIAFMQENHIDFSYAAYNLIDEDGAEKGYFSIPEKQNYIDLLKTCSIGCLTAIYDIKKLGKIKMPNIKRAQDYALWLRILKKTKYAYGLNEILGTYRLRNTSVSSNKFKKAKYQWKVYREVEKMGLFKSTFYFAHYAINGFRKYK